MMTQEDTLPILEYYSFDYAIADRGECEVMSYYCCDCMAELSPAWVEMWFEGVDPDTIQCCRCHKKDEQLNKGRDDD